MNTSTERRGLGRGLGELFQRTEIERPPAMAPTQPNGRQTYPDASHGPTSTESSVAPFQVPAGSYFAELPISSIVPNARQPRTAFDEEAMAELVEVDQGGGPAPADRRATARQRSLRAGDGERRWRAAQQADLPRVPAIVRETQDHDLLRDALLENLHRVQLNPLEEAAAYQQMLEDFGCTQEDLSARIKRSRPQISNTIRLLKLPPTVQRRVAAGVLSAGHARAILMVDDQRGAGAARPAGCRRGPLGSRRRGARGARGDGR